MNKTTTAKADSWEVATPLLRAMYGEFKELSKKKADGAVSKPKIAAVNRLLKKCREVLADEASLEFLDLLDQEEVPQNSDVVLLLSQYEAAMKQFHKNYWGGYSDGWTLEDGESTGTDASDDDWLDDEDEEDDRESDDQGR